MLLTRDAARKELLLDGTNTCAAGFIKLNKGKTHYQYFIPDNLASNYTVVMVHGTIGPMEVWNRTYTFLRENKYAVLRYDLFGRGQSAQPKTNYDLNLYIEQLAELLSKLQITGKIIFIAHSLGCIIATQFALRYPNVIAAFILISPSGFPFKNRLLARIIRRPLLGTIYMKLFGDAYLKRRFAQNYLNPNNYPDIEMAFARQIKSKGFKRAYHSTLINSPVKKYVQHYKELGGTAYPKILLWGRDDQIIPFKKSETAVKILSPIEFFPIDNSGHVPQTEQATTVNKIIFSFLTTIWNYQTLREV